VYYLLKLVLPRDLDVKFYGKWSGGIKQKLEAREHLGDLVIVDKDDNLIAEVEVTGTDKISGGDDGDGIVLWVLKDKVDYMLGKRDHARYIVILILDRLLTYGSGFYWIHGEQLYFLAAQNMLREVRPKGARELYYAIHEDYWNKKMGDLVWHIAYLANTRRR